MKTGKLTGLIALIMTIGVMTSACTAGIAESAGTGAGTTTIQTTAAKTAADGSSAGTASATPGAEIAGTAVAGYDVEYSAKDLETAFDLETAGKITLSDSGAAVAGEGITVDNNIVTIRSAGTYVLSGTMADGQIIVDAGDGDDVVLVLNGMDLTNTATSPIYIKNADKAVITLPEGTVNQVSDGTEYTYEETEAEEPDAAIFSKADLTINGRGSLQVNGNFSHGIVSKDDLKITGGILQVTAVNDGIKGKDCVAVLAGDITVDAGGDGIQASNAEDASLGFVLIEAGTLDITAGHDGIQAETDLLIKAGDITLNTGGGSANSSTSNASWGTWGGETSPGAADDPALTVSDSAKGIKAGQLITIDGGVIKADSSDDSIHSNGNITINGGTIQISSGDDGIHADQALTVNNGDIYIEKCYEGLEGAVITINDGDLHVGAMDDGINTAGGNDGSSVNGRPGQNGFDASDGSRLTINGGYVFISADGDGIDCNGDILMSSGTVVVNGPTANNNGAVDYNGNFTLTGGTLLAAGSSGMAQGVSDTSTQPAFLLNTSNIPAETLVHIEASTGETILTFMSGKTFGSIAFSFEGLKVGETYRVLTGGTSTGTATDGVYTGGSYTGGAELISFEMTSSLTAIGSGGMMQPGSGVPGKRP